ncbi:hypothetical protein GCM10023178_70220 [Actinomadura luteofluorescens]
MAEELLRLRVADDEGIFALRQAGRHVAAAVRLDLQDQVRVATALSEIGRELAAHAGTVAVGGVTGLRRIQRVAALGIVPGVTELDPALTVREHVDEALALREGVLGRFRGREARRRRTLERVGLDIAPGTLAEELAPDEAQLLGAALALAGDPGLLLLDDVDEGLPADRQRDLWRGLAGIAADFGTVIASCHDAAPAEGVATHTLPL